MEYLRPSPSKIKLVILVAIPLVLYWQDFILLGNEALNSELSTHIIFIPLLLGYMLYRIRHVLAASITFNSKDAVLPNGVSFSELIGVILFAISYLIKWYGSYTFFPLEYHVASIPILVSGLILILFNKETLRALIFPIGFLLFLIPPPVTFAQQTGAYMAVISAYLSFTILKITGFPVTLSDQYDAPIIYLQKANGQVLPFTIDLACSGLYSLIGLLVFAVFFAYISRGELKKKLAVLLISFPIIFATNVLRITFLILIGFYLGVGLTLNIAHLLGGWVLIFIGTSIILMLADRWFNINLFQQQKENCGHENSYEGLCLDCGKITGAPMKSFTRSESVKLVSIVLVTLVLLSIQVPVFTVSAGQSGVFSSDQVKIMDVLPEIEGYELSFVYRDTHFEKISRQNASIWYIYRPLDPLKPVIWVGLEVAVTRSLLHNWEVCLIVMPARANRFTNVKVDLRDVQLLDNPPLIGRYFAYHRVGDDLTDVILYWYIQSVFETQKGYQTLLTKISLLQYAPHPDEHLKAEINLLPVAKEVAAYWRPISTWSGIGIAIAKNGEVLIAAAGAFLLLVLGYQNYLHRRRVRAAKKIVMGLTESEDVILLQSINIGGGKPVKESAIADKYAELAGEHIDGLTLHNKLVKAEELGIIKSTISNIHNRPYHTWTAIN